MGTRFNVSADPDDTIFEEPGELPATTNGLASTSDSVANYWKEYNLLSLDGGGIRGYWSLLALQKLMEYIAEEELGNILGQHEHSFSPQLYPDNVSQGPFTEKEKNDLSAVADHEAKYRALSNARRFLPCHYFDYICGSSTGALIAIMLGRFRMTVPDCLYEYESLGGEIFGKPRFFIQLHFGLGNRTKYKAARLKKVFEAVTARRSEYLLETDARITFPSKRGLCRTFVTTLKTEPPKQKVSTLYLIRSYDHDERTTPDPSRGTTRRSTRRTTRSSTGRSRDTPAGDYSTARRNRNVNYGNAQAFQIWEVARAATAAPFYFEPLRIDTPGLSGNHLLFTDGGFNYTNNPTIEGTREIEDLYGSNSIGIVVSVGTARKDVPTNGGGIIGKMKGIANTAANPEPVHSDMLEKSRKEKFHYCRLNDLDRLNVDLDEWKPRRKLFTNQSGQKTLADIKAAFADWAMEVKTVQMLKTCAEELVVRRRARTEDAAKWERYAIGAQFRCQFKGCEREDFVSRSEFESHLRMDHHMPQAELQGEADSCRKYWRYQRADRR